MAIQNAMNLIRDSKTDEELREKLNSLPHSELESFLHSSGYKFTDDEFENATNMMHVKCQTYEEADELMQVVMWLKLLFAVYN